MMSRIEWTQVKLITEWIKLYVLPLKFVSIQDLKQTNQMIG